METRASRKALFPRKPSIRCQPIRANASNPEQSFTSERYVYFRRKCIALNYIVYQD